MASKLKSIVEFEVLIKFNFKDILFGRKNSTARVCACVCARVGRGKWLFIPRAHEHMYQADDVVVLTTVKF